MPPVKRCGTASVRTFSAQRCQHRAAVAQHGVPQQREDRACSCLGTEPPTSRFRLCSLRWLLQTYGEPKLQRGGLTGWNRSCRLPDEIRLCFCLSCGEQL